MPSLLVAFATHLHRAISTTLLLVPMRTLHLFSSSSLPPFNPPAHSNALTEAIHLHSCHGVDMRQAGRRSVVIRVDAGQRVLVAVNVNVLAEVGPTHIVLDQLDRLYKQKQKT